ncbi:MAG: hypothetical protein LBQ79_00750 [Deltaproteobacteria bacterium]|jgi:hypothetical protein|nr:hypothetical protein [Deltaproteobacteria bacterium]
MPDQNTETLVGMHVDPTGTRVTGPLALLEKVLGGSASEDEAAQVRKALAKAFVIPVPEGSVPLDGQASVATVTPPKTMTLETMSVQLEKLQDGFKNVKRTIYLFAGLVIAVLGISFNGLSGRMGGLESRMSGLESRTGGLESKMEARIGGLESKMEARIGGLESRIGGLESRMDARIGGMEARIGGMEARIVSLFEVVSRLREDFARIQGPANGPLASGANRPEALFPDDPADAGIPEPSIPAGAGR